jgi:RHS repeat-associated protein
MPMPNRTYSLSSSKYRFGFNTQEKDDEVYGEGNAIDFEARIYDSRIGRWFSTDPHKEYFPSLSPYHFGANSPIMVGDKDGNQNFVYIYIHPSVASIAKIDKQKLLAKVREVMLRVLVENPTLHAGLSFDFTDEAFNPSLLEQSDVLVHLTTPSDIYSTYPDPDFHPDENGYETQGQATHDGSIPAAVFPEHCKTLTYNGITPKYIVGPNYLDQIAYSIVHEAFHKLSFKYNAQTGNGDHDGGFMSSTSYNAASIESKGIKKSESSIFKLSEGRINFMNTNLGVYVGNGQIFRGFNKDNINKSESNKKTKSGGCSTSGGGGNSGGGKSSKKPPLLVPETKCKRM